MSIATTISPAVKARAIARNLDLFQDHLDATLGDPDHEPPDPVSVFLPTDDPVGFEENLALALGFACDGYDVDLRQVRARVRGVTNDIRESE